MASKPLVRMIVSRPPPCFQHARVSFPLARYGSRSVALTVTVTVTEGLWMEPSNETLAKVVSSESQSAALNKLPSMVTRARPSVIHHLSMTLVARNQAQLVEDWRAGLSKASQARRRRGGTGIIGTRCKGAVRLTYSRLSLLLPQPPPLSA